MDGIDYLNPSGICSSYERDAVTFKNSKPIPIPKKAEDVVCSYEALLESVKKHYLSLENLAILKRFCLANANENPEINYISVKYGKELYFKKIFFEEVNKLIDKEIARVTSCKEEV